MQLIGLAIALQYKLTRALRTLHRDHQGSAAPAHIQCLASRLQMFGDELRLVARAACACGVAHVDKVCKKVKLLLRV